MTKSNISLKQEALAEFVERAYLDYSMAVILDRALPHIADGLKPVQRRIIYAMSELGLKANAKYKKAARSVGDVLGKFHPHSDTACYEAMVLMAQPFSFRYPFVDGQGNFGSPDDPKSFAAMRYTEARLSAYAQLLLEELEKGTIAWVPNFDGTLDEPALLPARLPNVLLNGASGIAVGMATDIPPHNLSEVAQACIYLLENPDAKLKDVMRYLPGPDYPTAAEIITPKEELKKIYQTGQGTLRLRAAYRVEHHEIIIDALPFQVSGNKVLEQIASQMALKKLPTVADIRDESDHTTPTRLVITPRSNRVPIEELMAHLFGTTDLERPYRVNLNMIGVNGRPQVKNLLTILTEWIDHRIQTVEKRLRFELNQILVRLHILEGLLIAYLNLDKIIEIIRKKDDPKPFLLKQFSLTETQVDVVLEMKLKQLGKLEEEKIKTEQTELKIKKNNLEALLHSPAKLRGFIRAEIQADAKRYGDKRRCAIVERPQAKPMTEETLLPIEPVTIVLSEQGWVRSAKGHEIQGTQLTYRAGDKFLMQLAGRSIDRVIFLDNTGKCYSLLAHTLPSARSFGEPLSSRFKVQTGIHFVGMVSGNDDQLALLATDAGYGFLTPLSNMQVKSRSGKAILKCAPPAHALPPRLIHDEKYVAALSLSQRLLIFPLTALPELPKGKGNKIIQLSAKKMDRCLHVVALSDNHRLVFHHKQKSAVLTPKEWQNYIGERAKSGEKLSLPFATVDNMTIETV